MKTLTVKMPAFLASALVNGDVTGLSCTCPNSMRVRGHVVGAHEKSCDFRWLKAALDYCAPGQVVSTEGEPYFSWTCELPGWHLGADMLDYVVMYRDEDLP